MTGPVARRVELEREQPVDLGVSALTRVLIARADQLLVAVRRRETLTRCALAVPAGKLLVRELAVLRRIAVRAGAVGEAQALRPGASVDHADDDVLASRTRCGVKAVRTSEA